MKRSFLITVVLGLLMTPIDSYAGFLSEEELEQARTLAKLETKFEEFTQVLSTSNQAIKKDWLTLDKFQFKYKDEIKTFYIANSFSPSSRWGELAIYPETINTSKIRLTSPGSFSDLCNAEYYLSTLTYEYIPAKDSQVSHFIVERVEAGYGFDGKGYAQATLKYFLEEFVTKRTEICDVASDLRAKAPQHYFPQYGFIPGTLPGVTFERAMRSPFHWKRK